MYYNIMSKSRKYPTWQTIVIVPEHGNSFAAIFGTRQAAKEHLLRLRNIENQRPRQHSMRRTYKIVKSEAPINAHSFVAPDSTIAF